MSQSHVKIPAGERHTFIKKVDVSVSDLIFFKDPLLTSEILRLRLDTRGINPMIPIVASLLKNGPNGLQHLETCNSPKGEQNYTITPKDQESVGVIKVLAGNVNVEAKDTLYVVHSPVTPAQS